MAALTYAARGVPTAVYAFVTLVCDTGGRRPVRTPRADLARTSAIFAFRRLRTPIRPCETVHRSGMARAATFPEFLNCSAHFAFVSGGNS
jgi:hypothetical protein